MKRFIVMTSGYAEEATTAPLVYQCVFEEGYASIKEAITDLALDLYAKYYDAHLATPSLTAGKCCAKTLKHHVKAKFCMECGENLTDPSFEPEQFMGYVKELHFTITDSYGEAEATMDRDFCWSPYWSKEFIGATKEEIIYIAENAEQVLLGALIDAKPELVPEEQRQPWVDETTDWSQFRKELLPEYG